MDFEWDPAKAGANETKHGVSFFEACEVFNDDHSSTVRDPDHPLVMSYTERGERNRLISARQMTARERKAYEQR